MTRDLRKYVRQTNLRLIAGALVLLFVVVSTVLAQSSQLGPVNQDFMTTG